MSNIVKKEQQVTKLEELRALGQVLVKSGKYKGWAVEDFINVGMMADDLGISRMKAYNGGFYPVNGKISMSTGLMVDMIRSKGHSIKIIEMTDEKCVIIGQRKDNGDSCKCEFNKKDAERAGLLGSQTWQKWPKPMYYNRCMSMLARVLFSDILGGNVYNEDEKHDIEGTPPEKRPLEDPMPETIDVQVDIETGELKQEMPEVPAELEYLSNEHLMEIIELIGSNESLRNKLVKAKKVTKLSELLEKDYEGIVKGIRQHLEREAEEAAG